MNGILLAAVLLLVLWAAVLTVRAARIVRGVNRGEFL